MRKVDIEAQINYDAIVDAFIDPNITSIGLEGGTRSGKTFDWSIFLFQYCKKYTNKHIVIGRDLKTTLNITTYKTIQDVWKEFRDTTYFPKVASSMRMGGNQIDFIGLNDGDGKAQGLESDLLIVNEADLCDKDTFDQLEQRNKGFIIMDYNPRQVESWVYDREKLPFHTIHKTTILDNKYAPSNALRKVRSYEPTPENIMNGTADPYKWSVYGLGERTAGEDAVFTNVKRVSDFPPDLEWTLLGGDFGWKHDPTAIVKVARLGNRIYAKLLCYETGMLNNDIYQKLKSLNLTDEHVSVWDSANQKDIEELVMLGVIADGADKGPGSKAWGISKMQQYELCIIDDELSDILYQELVRLRWLKDRQGNYKKNSLGQRMTSEKESLYNGVRIKDDAVDALRYAVMYYLEPYNNEDQE